MYIMRNTNIQDKNELFELRTMCGKCMLLTITTVNIKYENTFFKTRLKEINVDKFKLSCLLGRKWFLIHISLKTNMQIVKTEYFPILIIKIQN